MEIICCVDREHRSSSDVQRNSSDHEVSRVTFIRLMGIINRIIKSYILLSVRQRLIHIGRVHIRNHNEPTLSMNLIDSIIEGVSLIDSMQYLPLDATLLIIEHSNLEIIIPSSSNNNILSIIQRMR
jgi:hypothetical protein